MGELFDNKIGDTYSRNKVLQRRIVRNMWVQIKSAPNLMIAEMWKEYFEGEGIPIRILPDPDKPGVGELASYRILVAQEKVHVVEEVLRKL